MVSRNRNDTLNRIFRPGVNFVRRAIALVKNGSFARDIFWTKGVGWTIGGGVADCDGVQVANSDLSQDGVNMAAGRKHQVTFTMTRTAGTLTPVLGGTALTPQIASGTIEESFTPTTDIVLFRADLNFIGTLDDIVIIKTGG